MRRSIKIVITLIAIAIIIYSGVYMRFFRGGPSKEEVIDSLFKYPEILDVTSTAFEAEGRIPVKYTCDGEDINPEIRWSQPPENTASLMIIMYDPDAPIGYFIHWVIYDLPSNLQSIPEGISSREKRAELGRETRNDFGIYGYGGPCPPSGSEHRYYFIVLALDTFIGEEINDPVEAISKAREHIIGIGYIYGWYSR